MNLIEVLIAAENAIGNLSCSSFLAFELDGLLGTLAAHRRALLHYGVGLGKLKDASAADGPIVLMERAEAALTMMLAGSLSVADRRVIAGAFFSIEAVRLTVADALAEDAVRREADPPTCAAHFNENGFLQIDLDGPEPSKELVNLVTSKRK